MIIERRMEMLTYSTLIQMNNIREAWQRVKQVSSDTPGVDGKKIEDMISMEEDFLLDLQEQLIEGTYQPSPVKEFVLEGKKGKKRTIGILTVQDRVVHTLIKLKLEPLVESKLIPWNFGYRPGKSALKAIEQIENWIKEGYSWFAETDIASFFDEVNHELLGQQLSYFVTDDELINFMKNLYSHPSVDKEGTGKGITQGSPLSPLLANVYLHRLDMQMANHSLPYIRYADDILMLGQSRKEMQERLNLFLYGLQELQLRHHPDKTRIAQINEGFYFLGFSFTLTGKAVGEKGIESLIERLEEAKIETLFIENRNEKYRQILNGWQQYYEGIPWESFHDPEVLILALEMEKDTEKIKQIYERVRSEWVAQPGWDEGRIRLLLSFSIKLNKIQDSLLWIAYMRESNRKPDERASIWLNRILPIDTQEQDKILELIKQIHFGHQKDKDVVQDELINRLIEHKLFKLAQLYHDPVQTYGQKIQMVENLIPDDPINEELQLFYDLFSGKEDLFLVEHLLEGTKRSFQPIYRAWNLEDVKQHWKGEMTIAQYLIRVNRTVAYAVIDIDMTKDQLAKIVFNEQEYIHTWEKTKEDALKIRETAERIGLSAYVVDSGYKGCHVWFFFEEPMQLNVAYEFLLKIISLSGGSSEGVVWQPYPNQRKLKEGNHGQAIKLPWGKHSISGRQAWFLDETGKPYDDQPGLLSKIKKNPRQKILQISQSDIRPQSEKNSRNDNLSDLNPPTIQFIVNGCPIMRHFIEKAEKTGFLNHQERLGLLNVFGPIGEEGRRFLHRVMSKTMNYNPDVTDKYIHRSFDRPISCVRIREHFPGLTAQLNCNCKFPDIDGAYPSPVLHDRKNIQLVRFNKEKKEKKPSLEAQSQSISNDEEMKRRVNELARQLIELRKHQRGINDRIKRIEKELSSYFDTRNINQIEVEFGFLVREVSEKGYHWVIHL